jgi:hypothetical protein
VLIGTYFFVRSMNTGPLALRILITYSLLIFAATLASPQVTLNYEQWEMLQRPGTGGRYFLIPMMGFFACLIWMAFDEQKSRWKLAARAVLGLSLVGIAVDFRHQPFYRLPFAQEVARFERAAPGTEVRIAINPPGWEMVLEKHR